MMLKGRMETYSKETYCGVQNISDAMVCERKNHIGTRESYLTILNKKISVSQIIVYTLN